MQACLFSVLWIVSCFLTAAFVLKLLEQNEHINGRFPSLCFHILCAFRALDALNAEKDIEKDISNLSFAIFL